MSGFFGCDLAASSRYGKNYFGREEPSVVF